MTKNDDFLHKKNLQQQKKEEKKKNTFLESFIHVFGDRCDSKEQRSNFWKLPTPAAAAVLLVTPRC